MKQVLLLLYEVGATIFPFLVLFVTLNVRLKRKGNTAIVYCLAVLLFATYILGVFHFTAAGTLYDLLLRGFEITPNTINLVPFSDADIDVVAYLLNVVLFIPLGILLPAIWPKWNSIKRLALAGLSFTLLIECSQLLNNRHTDVDDVILNTVGAVLGFVVFRCISKATGWRVNALSYQKREPYLYILSMFVGRFFLFNEFGMAKILYGF